MTTQSISFIWIVYAILFGVLLDGENKMSHFTIGIICSAVWAAA